MTANKHLKKRIRTRQAKTGESYVTARRHVLTAAATPSPPASAEPEPKRQIIELQNLTAHAATLGMRCMVFATASVVDPHGVLAELAEILSATADDPDMEILRAVIRRGEQIPFPPPQPESWWETIEDYLRRAQAGATGVSPAGHMLAFVHRERRVLANVGYRPRLILSDLAADGVRFSLLTCR